MKGRRITFLTFIFSFLILCLVALVLKSEYFRLKVKKRYARQFKFAKVVKRFIFEGQDSLKEWEEKIFRGRVVYIVERLNKKGYYVKGESKDAASALYYKIKMDSKKHPVISWYWKVNKFPVKSLPENLSSKKEEDFAARVYIIFPSMFFANSKVIEYIWAEKLPVGSHGPSGYSRNIQLIVLESGLSAGFKEERRDIYRDYVSLFGGEPKLNVGAIAFMTDSDSTGTSAEGLYRDIKLGYRKDK